ncbi:MAG TPA: tetratricopeptide repeat protein, partial [Hyphomicrobiaceae bacterium]|nr:tetratricopeptide repeat protein [Hyphomicrobiaceae bacterium]
FGMTIALLFGTGFLAIDRLTAVPPKVGSPGPAAGTTIVEMAPVTPHGPDRPARAPQTGAGETPSMGAMPIALPRVTSETPLINADDRAMGVPEGMETLKQAADGGDAFALFEIGRRFADGDGVPKDAARAAVWYERAAARGLALAQFRLATAYERGAGVAVDRARARVWYRRAAEQGYARAMHNLGVMVAEGGEPEADYAAAAGWFEQAADRGLADSQFNLAILRESGRGVQRDLTEAYKWFALAARQGDRAASRRLDQVKAAMWPDEVAAAERKLADWRPAPAEPAGVAAPQGGTAAR